MADIPNYCDIFDNCARCPAPFCPYEKLEDGTYSGFADDDEEEDEDEESSV